MRNGNYARAHAFGLIEGFADELVGKAYLEKIFEPSLQALTDKLRVTPGGPRDPEELRIASLIAIAPLLALCMHQDLLGGSTCAPIDLDNAFTFLNRWLGKALTPDPVS